MECFENIFCLQFGTPAPDLKRFPHSITLATSDSEQLSTFLQDYHSITWLCCYNAIALK